MSKDKYRSWAHKLARAYLDVLGDDATQLHVNAVSKLIRITTEYYENLPALLVRIIYEKKLRQIFSIHTKKEMEDLLRPSVPDFDGNKFYTAGKYYLLEEELYFWSTISHIAPMRGIGAERYTEVFCKIFPSQADRLNL